MATRTLTGIILQPDGTPYTLVPAAIFELLETIFAAASIYPRGTVPLNTDALGAFSLDLAVPDIGSAPYRVTFADGMVIDFALGPGVSIDLSTVLGTTYVPPAGWTWQLPFTTLPGMVALWDMENHSPLTDTSLGEHHLTQHGTPTFGISANGGSYATKAAVDYWDADDAAWNSITGEIFIAGWVKFDSVASAIELIMGKWTSAGNQRCWNLQRGPTGMLTFLVNPDGTSPTTVTAISYDNLLHTGWTFVAARFIPSISLTVWVNDQLTNFVNTIPAAMIDGTGKIELGSFNGGTYGMHGSMGVMGLYNQAPTDQMVSDLYNSTKFFYNPLTIFDISYPSTIDAITLKGRIAYPINGANMPVLVAMHSYGSDATVYTIDMLQRWSTAYGGDVFIVIPDLRGRRGSGGTRDSGGREIQDIKDAVDYVKTTYPSLIDATQIHITGYSGGGGNAFSCAARFPDLFNQVISYFGISDYGYNAADGWYQASPDFRAQLVTDIGDPAAVPDAYHARASVLAITNYSAGKLWMFQDTPDAVVNKAQSTRCKTAKDNAGQTNYAYALSVIGDVQRWWHGNPIAGSSLINGEARYMTPICNKTQAAWTVPANGTLQVAGFLETKRFKIWLGTGLIDYATVTYGATPNVYTVVPLTGSMSVTITQADGKIATQVITTTTDITVS